MITEDQLDSARSTLRAYHRQERILNTIEHLITDVQNGNLTSYDDLSEAVDYMVEQDTTWTSDCMEVLLCADDNGRNAFTEIDSSPPTVAGGLDWSTLAFHALREEVNEVVQDYIQECENSWCRKLAAAKNLDTPLPTNGALCAACQKEEEEMEDE